MARHRCSEWGQASGESIECRIRDRVPVAYGSSAIRRNPGAARSTLSRAPFRRRLRAPIPRCLEAVGAPLARCLGMGATSAHHIARRPRRGQRIVATGSATSRPLWRSASSSSAPASWRGLRGRWRAFVARTGRCWAGSCDVAAPVVASKVPRTVGHRGGPDAFGRKAKMNECLSEA